MEPLKTKIERCSRKPLWSSWALLLQKLYAAGQKPEGQITEVSYMFVRPGPDTKPVPKISLVTRVGDIYCGVGYYK